MGAALGVGLCDACFGAETLGVEAFCEGALGP